MFDLADLSIPMVAAPMAGGVSTPDLVAAATAAGGLGFLAAGYQTPDALARQIADTRVRTAAPFGVNIFVPEDIPFNRADLERYRAQLADRAASYGLEVPPVREHDDDWYPDKIDLVLALDVPIVSFTFGLPAPDVLARLHAADTYTIATCTSPDDARAAAATGVRALCVQGPDAGAHRGTFHCADTPATTPLPELVARVAAETGLPVIAAGGITRGHDIAALSGLGAAAFQVGTALLRSVESGARQAHKDALVDPGFRETVVTRAFTGRPARGLRNDFIAGFESAAPHVYPQVHHLTSPLRAAAAARGNPQDMALWAGVGFRSAQARPAADILTDLWESRR